MKKAIWAVVVLVLGGLLAFTLMPSLPSAPNFQVNDLKGNPINNHHLQGKVTLLNFWFPTCPGCVSEMPKLIKMSQDYQGKDFQILGLAVPVDSANQLDSVQNYVQTRQLPFTVMFDENKTVTKLFVKTELYPTSVLINKKGEILKTFVGEPNFQELYKEVDLELAK